MFAELMDRVRQLDTNLREKKAIRWRRRQNAKENGRKAVERFWNERSAIAWGK